MPPYRRIAPPKPPPTHPVERPLTLDPAPTYHDETAIDVGTGRDFKYEWELFVQDILPRIYTVEVAVANLQAGGGGGGGTGLSFVYHQNTAAASWNIVHGLGTKPVIAIVSIAGALLYAEVTYVDNNTVHVVHSAPYAGTAYLYA